MTDEEIYAALKAEACGKRKYIVIKRKRFKKFLAEVVKLRRRLVVLEAEKAGYFQGYDRTERGT